jgi:multisubunit Na+/H+ antiporter MnhC subunit
MRLENKQGFYASLAILLIVIGGATVFLSHSYHNMIIGLSLCAIGGGVYYKHFKSRC